MEKVIYALWRRPDHDLAPIGEWLTSDVVTHLGGRDDVLGARVLVEAPEYAIPARSNPHGELCGLVSVWLPTYQDRDSIDDLMRDGPAHEWHAWLVCESVPTAYGAELTWPMGGRSPGLTQLTLFDKPSGLDEARFYRLWHVIHRRTTADVHPLWYYVRNEVVRSLTQGAPPVRESSIRESVTRRTSSTRIGCTRRMVTPPASKPTPPSSAMRHRRSSISTRFRTNGCTSTWCGSCRHDGRHIPVEAVWRRHGDVIAGATARPVDGRVQERWPRRCWWSRTRSRSVISCGPTSKREGYSVLSTGSGAEAIEMTRAAAPNLVVLDLRLPDVSGETVAGEIRRFSNVPVLMLTAKSAEQDRIRGLEVGADDYVTKPFSPREVVLRAQAILRRTAVEGPAGAVAFGGAELVIDEDRRTATVRGALVELTPTEWGVLVAVARVPGRVYSRYELINRVRGDEFEGYERTIDSHVKNLRRKIELDPRRPKIVETVLGAGYRLGLACDT